MLATASQALRFTIGLRAFLHQPIDLPTARAEVLDRHRTRDGAFIDVLDRLVWAHAGSPYRSLFEHLGIGRRRLVEWVRHDGLDVALCRLRDAGGYVSDQEYRGTEPARRGRTTFHWTPDDFLNPVVRADYMGRTGGTRSGGTAVGKSFAHLRAVAAGDLVVRDLWDIHGVPQAIWLPVLPSSAGLNNVLRLERVR